MGSSGINGSGRGGRVIAAETAPPGDEDSVAVNGRSFQGKRAVFDDSDEEEVATRYPGSRGQGSAPSIEKEVYVRKGKVQGTVNAKVPRKKKKKKTTQGEALQDSKRNAKRKVKLPKPQCGAPLRPDVARKPRKKARNEV